MNAIPATAVAVSEGALDPKHFLGRLATYTNPDAPVPGSKFLRLWGAAGLDVNDLPEARSPVHVFQSACASVKARATNGHGEKTEITADEVENNGACVYQITVKVWDTRSGAIEFEKALRVTFNKQTNDIGFDDLGYQDVRLSEIENAIRKHFDANQKTVPGPKVRNAVREQLLRIGAQNLRRKAGGLYFVPSKYRVGRTKPDTKPVLDGLASVLDGLYGDRADFYTIPLVNGEGQRAMVRKHFMLNANAQLQELTEKAINRVRQAKAAGSRPVREELVVNLYNEQRKIMGAIADFEALVQVEQKDIQANLRDFEDAIRSLEALRNA